MNNTLNTIKKSLELPKAIFGCSKNKTKAVLHLPFLLYFAVSHQYNSSQT